MVRKLLAIMGVAALAAVLAPVSAQAAPEDNSGVVVFIGSATVGSAAHNEATGEGLCFPNLTAQGGQCVADPGEVTAVTNGWKFDVPGNDVGLPGGGTISATCNAYGRFGGQTVFTSSTSPGNCEIASDGDVGLSELAPIGPSCGLSGGTSDAGDNAAAGDLPDNFTVAGLEGPIYTRWVSSAGGTLPIIGHYTVDDVTANYVGLVQARPLPQSGGVPCLTEPATDFTVVGVVAGSEAAPDVNGAV